MHRGGTLHPPENHRAGVESRPELNEATRPLERIWSAAIRGFKRWGLGNRRVSDVAALPELGADAIADNG